jgi:hypothetical protein
MNLGIISFFISSIIIVSCKSSSKCLRFQKGKFYTFSPVTGNKIIIDRKDTLQIETDEKTSVVLKSKIVWKNACEYEIIAISDNKAYHDGIDSFFSITPIKVTIIGVGNDFYVFKARVDSLNKYMEYSDTIRILK